MFPKYLDGAEVIFYTNENEYGDIFYNDGRIYAKVKYYAICRYESDEKLYLFSCDAQFNVVADIDCSTLEDCKEITKNKSSIDIYWHKLGVVDDIKGSLTI